MTQEEILKKAQEVAGEIGCAAYYGGTIIDEDEMADIFLRGANWRIDSVWHDGSVKPDTDKGDLLIVVKDAFEKDVYVHQNAYYALKYGCVRWAYIRDLIPNQEN